MRVLISTSSHFAEMFGVPSTVTIMNRALEQNESDKDLCYEIAYVLFKIVDSNPIARSGVATDECVQLLGKLLGQPHLYDLSVAATSLLYGDRGSRKVFALPLIAQKVVNVINTQSTTIDCLYNGVNAVYFLSKLAETRDWLASHPVAADQALLVHANSSDAKLKANVARAMKNLQSDGNEAIEEGAVANLIAMSLEGKAQRTKVGDELREPTIAPFQERFLPDTGLGEFDPSAYHWHCEKTVNVGGEVGDGPDHPAPPSMISESAPEFSNSSLEELDNSEVEGKAKMSFAKMQVPGDVKTSFVLEDADFNVKDDETELEEGSLTQGGDSFMPGGDMENSAVLGLPDSGSAGALDNLHGSIESKNDELEDSNLQGNSVQLSEASLAEGDEKGKKVNKKKKSKAPKARSATSEGERKKEHSSPSKKPHTTQPEANIGAKAQKLGLYT
jgi:hypothetical protein